MKMDELAVYLKEVFCIELLSAILSNPRDREKAWKVRIRPVLKKEELVFQFEVFIGTVSYTHLTLPTNREV